MRKRINTTQEQLASLFGIDQTTVCRYLKLVDNILEQILPTARNVSDMIQSDEKSKQMRKTLGRVLLIDGMHVPVQRSGDSKQRKRSYSGKKEGIHVQHRDNNKHQRNHNTSNQELSWQ